MDDSYESFTFLGLFFIGLLAMTFIYNLVNIETPDLPELHHEPIPVAIEVEENEEIREVEEEVQKVKEPVLTDEEILAMIAMSEAGNQDMLGKVAVIATVLNRCDMWGLTVETVVKQPNQYSFPYYGTVSDECYRAVEIATENRDLFPSDMIYFRNTNYHDFGVPYNKFGDHYFSLEEEKQQ